LPQSPQKPLQKLPNPELNPLLNPTLGNNLGRWAQAYFTSPPEKREEAVLELLHELEAEAGSSDASINAGADPSWLHSLEGSQLNPALTCAECGHKNAPQQRFCGMCGSRLVFPDSPVEADARTHFEQTPAPPESAAPTFLSQPVPSFGSPLSLFATAPSSDTDSGSDVQWLHEKGYGSDVGMENDRSSTKYWVTALGVLLLGVLLYAQWKPQKGHSAAVNSPAPASHPATTQEQAPAKSPEPAPPAAAQPAANTQAAESQTSAKGETPPAQESASVNKKSAPEAQEQHTPNAPKVQSAPQDQPAPVRNAATVLPEASPTAAGSAELATAEGYLTGRYGSRNSSEAARYLWKAVAKENPTAIMLLSNLYLAGDGVPKSCDQAKLLLRAGAQKNISEAANKLRQLQRTGCP
jgi:pyruvate/2-oxoglutarate dehydrogenase complex dihydrolipoamide acyltransferase (E2) component